MRGVGAGGARRVGAAAVTGRQPQKTRASVSGHRRNWAFPVMYFSGAKFQVRLP